MTEIKFSQAATALLKARKAGVKRGRLAEQFRPNSSEDALQIQQQMIAQRADQVGGWKCLHPLGKDQFIVAPIFTDTIQRGAQCFLFADDSLAQLEPEIAFVLGEDLPAQQKDYSEQQIDAAIASCHMALELIQSRFANDCDASFYEKLADGLSNQGLFIGPEITKSQAYAASDIKVSFKQGAQSQQFSGKHPNIFPQSPIYWLINFMSKRGTDFKAGEAIITGSYAGVVKVQFDRVTEIEYKNLGKYSLEFKALK
ncbi:MAG: 2-keto-4-pentenoate hydratase [Psychromonas sp.]|jgi:2-keto-4-pentenoate hydratase|uniref:hydratase n=1 Tax=Psychromonas sp. TaxID=1884585 RepID=UPI0039E48226